MSLSVTAAELHSAWCRGGCSVWRKEYVEGLGVPLESEKLRVINGQCSMIGHVCL